MCVVWLSTGVTDTSSGVIVRRALSCEETGVGGGQSTPDSKVVLRCVDGAVATDGVIHEMSAGDAIIGVSLKIEPPPTADKGEQTTPPTEQTPPPTEQTPTPTEQTPFPTEQTPTPTEQTSPSTEQTPTPADQTPFPTEQTPTPTEQTPTPTKQTPPSTELSANAVPMTGVAMDAQSSSESSPGALKESEKPSMHEDATPTLPADSDAFTTHTIKKMTSSVASVFPQWNGDDVIDDVGVAGHHAVEVASSTETTETTDCTPPAHSRDSLEVDMRTPVIVIDGVAEHANRSSTQHDQSSIIAGQEAFTFDDRFSSHEGVQPADNAEGKNQRSSGVCVYRALLLFV